MLMDESPKCKTLVRANNPVYCDDERKGSEGKSSHLKHVPDYHQDRLPC
jgi:hypothetical protein